MNVLPVTAERWEDMVTLFERRGARGGYRNTPAYGCWCMYWRDRSVPHGEAKNRRCASSSAAVGEGGGAVWSLICFVVDKDAQRRGVARELLAAAVEHAFAGGATSVEAYPHKTEKTNYMGQVSLFADAGFRPVRETSKRVVMRRDR